MCLGGGKSQEIKETPEMVAHQEINAQLWNYYQEHYRPLLEKYVSKTISPEVEAEEEKYVAGQIRAEAMKNISPSKVSENPVENAQRLTDVAKLETGAQVQGQGGVRSRKLGEIQNIIDIGRGEATAAQVGLGELGAESLRAEISNRQLEEKERAATEETYGSIAGAIAGGLLKARPRTLQPRTVTPSYYDWDYDWGGEGQNF